MALSGCRPVQRRKRRVEVRLCRSRRAFLQLLSTCTAALLWQLPTLFPLQSSSVCSRLPNLMAADGRMMAVLDNNSAGKVLRIIRGKRSRMSRDARPYWTRQEHCLNVAAKLCLTRQHGPARLAPPVGQRSLPPCRRQMTSTQTPSIWRI